MRGTEVTAVFDDGEISGFAGCSNYSGGYVTASAVDENAIAFSALTATGLVCDQQVMDKESRYLSALQVATSYTIEGDELTIYFPGGRLVYYNQ